MTRGSKKPAIQKDVKFKVLEKYLDLNRPGKDFFEPRAYSSCGHWFEIQY